MDGKGSRPSSVNERLTHNEGTKNEGAEGLIAHEKLDDYDGTELRPTTSPM